jgi:hypothetical protein
MLRGARGVRLVVSALVVCAALGTVEEADAQQAARTERASLSGIEHEFYVPPNWEFLPLPKENQVHFKPAQNLMQKGKREELVCGMTVFEGDMGADPITAIKTVADGQKKNYPWMELSDPKDMVFAGAKGALIVLVGNNPEKGGQSEAMVIAMAQLGKNVYLFLGQGYTEDIGALAGDMGMIINGVRPLSGAGAGPNGPNVGGPGRNRPPPAGPSVVDPPWGIEVTGLSTNWRVANEQGKYVFYSSSPQATITVSHAWADGGYAKRIKGAKKGKLGELDALVVEDKSPMGTKLVRYHVIQGEQVTIVEFTSTEFDAAQSKVWPEFSKSLKITKMAAPKRGGKKGATVNLANGVSVDLGKPWSFEDFVASGATFKVADKGGDVYVQVRTAKAGGDDGADPFTPQVNKVKIQCQTDGGIYDEGKVEFAGAKRTYRLRCKPSPKAAADKKKKFRPMEIVVIEGKGVHVMLFARPGTDKITEPPDGAVEKFLAGMKLP